MREFEQIVCERGSRSGAAMAIAVHSTRLGPALGGARMWHYSSSEAAIADAMRLGEAMTLKAAVAGLELGGGKGVLATPNPQAPTGELRRAMLEDFGDLVESLEGAYITAEDVGTSPVDMEVIAERTAHVVGRDRATGGSGDPSPVTALGVLAAIRACASARWPGRGRDLGGLRVCVVGLGHVGSNLLARLATEGAELLASDIDPAKRAAAEGLGAEWLEPADALRARCDVLAPCALGGAITSELTAELRAGVICGAANNILADRSLAGELRRA
ncbi:MAG: Glu/Leu/Phe/Val dehydrogenase dimerization domain-containing protein, partial [Solirubrobacterales bacterium]